MPLDNPVIAVIGSGAIGSFYGAVLAHSGLEVHFHFRSDLAAVRQHGLIVRSLKGDLSIRPAQLHAHGDAREMPRSDVIIVALKATANDQFDKLIRPLLKDDSIILCMQNGIGNEEQLGELFGPQRVIGVMAFVGCVRVEPGVIEHVAYGQLRIGELVGGPTDRTGRIARFSRAPGFRARFCPTCAWAGGRSWSGTFHLTAWARQWI